MIGVLGIKFVAKNSFRVLTSDVTNTRLIDTQNILQKHKQRIFFTEWEWVWSSRRVDSWYHWPDNRRPRPTDTWISIPMGDHYPFQSYLPELSVWQPWHEKSRHRMRGTESAVNGKAIASTGTHCECLTNKLWAQPLENHLCNEYGRVGESVSERALVREREIQ